MRNKSGQVILRNIFLLFLLGVMIYIASIILSPLLPAFSESFPLGIRILIILIVPTLFLAFILYGLKTIRAGEGGAAE